MKFNWKKEFKESNEWLARESNRRLLYEMQMQEIRELLSNDVTLDSVESISPRLGRLAFWHGQKAFQGATATSEVSAINWSVYFDYIRHSMRMRVLRIEQPNGNGNIGAYEIHSHFTLLLGIGLVDEAIWLGQHIYDSIKRRMKQPVVWTLLEISEADLDRPIASDDDSLDLNSDNISGYSKSPLCGLVLKMWLVLTGRREPMDRLPEKAPQCGIYDPLFEHWDHLEKLTAAISTACDFHLRRMNDDRKIRHDIAEFRRSPFREVPFEILAYRNLRRHLGLETPFPAHPLLDSPFVKSLPEEITPSGDPLLAEVLEYARKVLPNL